MKRSIYLFSILLFLGIFAVHFTVYMAFADDSQIQPIPEPVDATTVKSSKSNSSERQIEPIPDPVEATTVKSSKSNSSERQIEPMPKPVEATTVKSSKSNASE